jgi:tRNA pseudouridine38-40 synthase
VQAVIEAALVEFTGERIRVTAAGRTDAGVHAVGQLASFHTSGDIPPIGFRLGLQTKLPDDIVVIDAIEVPYGFSARYDTLQKTYRYVIQNSRLRTPWLRNHVGWHRVPLDDRAMQTALNVLVGTHDFRSFETDWPNKATSVRTVLEARIWRCDPWNAWMWEDGSGKAEVGRPSTFAPEPSTFLCIDITADGFLYNMVRAIVGTLIHVGRGNWTADDVRQILLAQDRSVAGETAPAEGLYLLRCEYEVNPQRIAERISRPRPSANHGK